MVASAFAHREESLDASCPLEFGLHHQNPAADLVTGKPSMHGMSIGRVGARSIMGKRIEADRSSTQEIAICMCLLRERGSPLGGRVEGGGSRCNLTPPNRVAMALRRMRSSCSSLQENERIGVNQSTVVPIFPTLLPRMCSSMSMSTFLPPLRCTSNRIFLHPSRSSAIPFIQRLSTSTFHLNMREE